MSHLGITGDDLSDPRTAEARLRDEILMQSQNTASYRRRGMRDVTEDFVAASKRLPSGELVQDENFTLFEAVGALEIMDPKMDSGYIPPGDSFDAQFDACQSLSANEVLWIMDELFRLEMNFHDGYPLSQNIFTSLHVFRLLSPDNRYPYMLSFDNAAAQPSNDMIFEQQLVHVVLRAYCVAVIKCAELTLRTIQSQTFYEEEDFVTYLFGYDLLPRLESLEALRLISHAEDLLQTCNLDSQLKSALQLRLAIRSNLLTAMEGKLDQWEQIHDQISGLQESHGLCIPSPAAFSNKVTRQLATSTPPRPMPEFTWDDAWREWMRLCDDLAATQKLTSQSMRDSPHCLQRATWAFSYRKPQPIAYARAKMQEILTADGAVAGDVSHFELMLTDIRDFVLAGDPLAAPDSFQVELPTDVRFRASRLIEDFMSKAFEEYLNIYRMICQNRCRMRRAFTQTITVLDELEAEALEYDRQLNEIIVPRVIKTRTGASKMLTPLCTWTRMYKLQMMEWTIQLGFETDIYLSQEMSNVHAILQNIASMRIDVVELAQQFVEARLDDCAKNADAERVEQCLISEGWLNSLLSKAKTTVSISRALADLYALLERLCIIDARRKPYEEPERLYEARMKPFLGLADDQMPCLEQLLDAKPTNGMIINEICSNITLEVKTCRDLLLDLKKMTAAQAKYIGTEDMWTTELKALETVCVAISVAVSQLRQICEKYGKVKVTEGESLRGVVILTIPPPGKTRYHDWWVVPQLREKK